MLAGACETGVLTDAALSDYSELAHGCLLEEVDRLLVKKVTDAQFFDGNPLENAAWATAAQEQSVDPATIDVPAFLVQSLTDNVVLPNSNALLRDESCEAGEPFSVSWLDTAEMGGMLAMDWLQDRYDGPPTSTCTHPLPLASVSTTF